MREIKFRGYRVDGHGWVYGSLTISDDLPVPNGNGGVKNMTCYFIQKRYGDVYHVYERSVGMHWIDGIYEGDIFVVDGLYPFFKDNHNNYVGTIDYVPHRGWAGWYYGMHCINDNLKGSACGGSLSDLEDDSIRVIGNTYENPKLIKELEK